eukprot:scaffold358803_cov17-Prasinocladus_malaysianus.AAC.1
MKGEWRNAECTVRQVARIQQSSETAVLPYDVLSTRPAGYCSSAKATVWRSYEYSMPANTQMCISVQVDLLLYTNSGTRTECLQHTDTVVTCWIGNCNNGTERNGMGWDGKGWNRMDWTGLEWTGMDWNGMELSG